MVKKCFVLICLLGTTLIDAGMSMPGPAAEMPSPDEMAQLMGLPSDFDFEAFFEEFSKEMETNPDFAAEVERQAKELETMIGAMEAEQPGSSNAFFGAAMPAGKPSEPLEEKQKPAPRKVIESPHARTLEEAFLLSLPASSDPTVRIKVSFEKREAFNLYTDRLSQPIREILRKTMHNIVLREQLIFLQDYVEALEVEFALIGSKQLYLRPFFSDANKGLREAILAEGRELNEIDLHIPDPTAHKADSFEQEQAENMQLTASVEDLINIRAATNRQFSTLSALEQDELVQQLTELHEQELEPLLNRLSSVVDSQETRAEAERKREAMKHKMRTEPGAKYRPSTPSYGQGSHAGYGQGPHHDSGRGGGSGSSFVPPPVQPQTKPSSKTPEKPAEAESSKAGGKHNNERKQPEETDSIDTLLRQFIQSDTVRLLLDPIANDRFWFDSKGYFKKVTDAATSGDFETLFKTLTTIEQHLAKSEQLKASYKAIPPQKTDPKAFEQVPEYKKAQPQLSPEERALARRAPNPGLLANYQAIKPKLIPALTKLYYHIASLPLPTLQNTEPSRGGPAASWVEAQFFPQQESISEDTEELATLINELVNEQQVEPVRSPVTGDITTNQIVQFAQVLGRMGNNICKQSQATETLQKTIDKFNEVLEKTIPNGRAISKEAKDRFVKEIERFERRRMMTIQNICDQATRSVAALSLAPRGADETEQAEQQRIAHFYERLYGVLIIAANALIKEGCIIRFIEPTQMVSNFHFAPPHEQFGQIATSAADVTNFYVRAAAFLESEHVMLAPQSTQATPTASGLPGVAQSALDFAKQTWQRVSSFFGEQPTVAPHNPETAARQRKLYANFPKLAQLHALLAERIKLLELIWATDAQEQFASGAGLQQPDTGTAQPFDGGRQTTLAPSDSSEEGWFAAAKNAIKNVGILGAAAGATGWALNKAANYFSPQPQPVTVETPDTTTSIPVAMSEPFTEPVPIIADHAQPVVHTHQTEVVWCDDDAGELISPQPVPNKPAQPRRGFRGMRSVTDHA